MAILRPKERRHFLFETGLQFGSNQLASSLPQCCLGRGVKKLRGAAFVQFLEEREDLRHSWVLLALQRLCVLLEGKEELH